MVNVGLNLDMDIQDLRRKNLRHILDTRFGGVMSRLADAVGRQPSYISRMLAEEGKAGRKGFGEDLARKFEESLGLSRGALDQDDSQAHSAIPRVDANVAPGPDVTGLVPLISWVQAGNWGEVIDNFSPGDAEEWLPSFKKMGPYAFALRVRGGSMERKYQDGDIIFVDPDVGASSGRNVVVRMEDENTATFKHLVIDEAGNKFLKPLNPDWPGPKVIQINGNARICGVVVGKWVPE